MLSKAEKEYILKSIDFSRVVVNHKLKLCKNSLAYLKVTDKSKLDEELKLIDSITNKLNKQEA